MAKTTEAVVIGGGVIGISILYSLTLRGVQSPCFWNGTPWDRAQRLSH